MAASRKKKRKKYFVTASGALLLLSAAQLQLPARPLLIPIGRAAPCPCARCFLLLASRPCTAPRTHAHTHARIPIRALFGAVSACRYSLCVKDSKQDQGREAAAAAATVPARHARTCQRRARAQAKHVDRPRVCIPPRRATPMSMRAARRSTDDDDGGHGSRRRRRQGQETQEEGGLLGRPAAQWELRIQQGNQSAWSPPTSPSYPPRG